MVGEGKRRGAVLSKACGYEIGLRPVSNGRRTKTGTFGRTRNWMGLKNTSYKEMEYLMEILIFRVFSFMRSRACILFWEDDAKGATGQKIKHKYLDQA